MPLSYMSHKFNRRMPELHPYTQPVQGKPDELIILRDPELVIHVQELRHVLTSTAVPIRGYWQDSLDMPIIDFDAMLEFIFADLARIIQGEISAAHAASRYIFEEVLERDAEYTTLLHGVKDLTERIIKLTSRALLDHPIDHHVPHQYQLQQVLPSGGLVLERKRLPHQSY